MHVRVERGSRRNFSGDLMIKLPREIALVKIETEGGNIDTSGVAGRVEAESGGGSMHLDEHWRRRACGNRWRIDRRGNHQRRYWVAHGGRDRSRCTTQWKITAETGGGSIEIVSRHTGSQQSRQAAEGLKCGSAPAK